MLSKYLILFLLILIILFNYIQVDLTPETFKNTENIIMTTYFCKKKDPQRKTFAPCNDIKYIKPWYNSIKKLGINGIIFHDGLGKEFINKYQTDKIIFEYINSENFEYSLNDQRFFIYLDYLRKHPEIQNIFMTDGNDVTVVKSPFNKFKKICVGQDADDNGDDIYTNHPYIQHQLKKYNNNSKWGFKIDESNTIKFYNAGILGGNREQVLFFLENMVEIFSKMNPEQKKQNLNMVVFNYVVHFILNKDVETDAPLCSRFKKYQNDRKDVYFIHK